MLVLGRKVNQSLDLFDRKTGELIARITFCDTRGSDQIGLGVEARKEVLVLRSELSQPRVRTDEQAQYRSEMGKYPS